MAEKTLYTALGHFRCRNDGGGRRYPVILMDHREFGMDPQEMIDDLKAGAAGSRQLELLGPKMVRHDFAPGFFVKHFIKDMRLADAEAKEDGLQLNVLQTVLDNFEQLAEEGHADDGTQCLITRYLNE